MTESIFDPTGSQTERSGSRYMGPAADNDSQMPMDVTDGRVDETEVEAAPDADEATEQIAGAEADLEAQRGDESQSEI